MFNLNFNTYADINSFAGIVGVDGLLNAYRSHLLDIQTRQMIKDAVELANKTEFCMKSFNDGDNVWEIYVYVDPDNYLNTVYHHTMGEPMAFWDLTDEHKSESDTIVEAIQMYNKNRYELCHLVGVDLAK